VLLSCSLTTLETGNVALTWVYIAILKIVALVLAFKTRSIKIIALNDAKFIAAIVYITSILIVFKAVIYFTLNDKISLYYILFSSTTYISVAVMLGLTFIPKVIPISVAMLYIIKLC